MRLNPADTWRGSDAVQHNARAKQRYQAIRADRMLTDEGKRHALARAWWEAQTAIKQLEAGEMAERASRRKTLSDKLFKPSTSLNSTDVIATRDAADRVSRVESAEEAMRLMKSALFNDDERLIKALGKHCYDQGWTAPLQEWSDAKPYADVENQINELVSIETVAGSIAQAMQSAVSFECEKPHEVNLMSRAVLDSVVGGDTLALETVGDMTVRTRGGMSDRREDYALPTDQRQTAAELAVSFGQSIAGSPAVS